MIKISKLDGSDKETITINDTISIEPFSKYTLHLGSKSADLILKWGLNCSLKIVVDEISWVAECYSFTFPNKFNFQFWTKIQNEQQNWEIK